MATTKIFRSKAFEVVTHILLWGVFFIFLAFFSPVRSHEAVDTGFIAKSTAIFIAFFMIAFYVNYFLLIEWLIFNKKILVFVGINILLIALCSWLHDLVRMEMPQHPNPGFFMKPGGPKPNKFLFIIKMAGPFVLPVVMSVAIKITQHWFKTETEKKEIENKNLESELEHLRYQIQPHFFFNSLNNIYSLIEVSPAKAQETVHSLSKLMRYLLYETGNPKVELSKEITFLKKYIGLMELRLSEKIKVTAAFPSVLNHYEVAPLLFVPLIENAYKHGISGSQPSFIIFEMTITGDTLYFVTENSNFPKTDQDKSGSGIGLQNLQKRLQLLYPDRHSFKTEVVNGIFKTQLVIELT